MSTTTDTITRQVSEQVKRAMEAANSVRPLPHFDYIPTHGGEPPTGRSGYHPPVTQSGSRRYRGRTKALGRCAAARRSGRPMQGATTKSTTASTPYATHSRQTAWGHPMLRRPPPMIAPPKPQNAKKYCEFHEQSGHTTTEEGPGSFDENTSPHNPNRRMRSVRRRLWPQLLEVMRKE
ncbi:hypothetical protein Cgig2_000017 [Carnegiea gigantea]|uniref:Uncharacterized protein n=1 Tax=Carnegiea gigantea TaxID=171969 RepID=A0A9Q1QRA4_9CARY|nr:hypothetical protein Cgig2_000017 [Carnegiea gigantea]